MKIVGITACPTGIAHTYMAQAGLEKECKKRGFTAKIETQGSMGSENELTEREIREADVVILAVDITIEGQDRFDDKLVLEVNVGKAVTHPEQVIDQAIKLFESNK